MIIKNRNLILICMTIISHQALGAESADSNDSSVSLAVGSAAATGILGATQSYANKRVNQTITTINSLEAHRKRVDTFTPIEATTITNAQIAQEKLREVQMSLQENLNRQVNAEKAVLKIQQEIAELEKIINPLPLRHEIQNRQRMAIAIQQHISGLEMSKLAPEVQEAQIQIAKADLAKLYQEISALEERIYDQNIRRQIRSRNQALLGHQMAMIELKSRENKLVAEMRLINGRAQRLAEISKQYVAGKNLRVNRAEKAIDAMKERLSFAKGMRLINGTLLGTAIITFGVSAKSAIGATTHLDPAEYQNRNAQPINSTDLQENEVSAVNDALRAAGAN
jgi:hypothetical protein